MGPPRVDEEVFTVPMNWTLPIWTGVCQDCESESINIMATMDENFNIEMYDLHVTCSWCGKDYAVDAPKGDLTD